MTDHTLSPSDAAPESTRSDADLVLRTRSGDAGAYAELWRRHYAAGITVARSITSAFDADDLVQESFAKIYQAIQKGGGPTGSFRAYLFTSIRNTAAGWGRARREAPIDELDTVADPASTDQAANDALDRSLSAQAFRSLPSRWQEVLWYSEIEQMKPAEIAPLLGMTAGATAQLAFRAREGLREAWIQAHLSTAEAGSVCEWTIERLGAYSRGNLGVRDRAKLENHLGECARCLIVAAEAKEVSHRLAFVLLPLVLGIGGSGAYLAMLQSGSAPIVALAAMPSSVVQGAVVAGSAGVGAAGAVGHGAAGAAGAATHGTAGAAGSAGSGGSTGGLAAGFGALVGAGSAALVIAGAIVAAAVVPGFTANPASTSAPSASDQSESGIVAQVSPPANLPVTAPAPAPVPAPQPEKPKTIVNVPVDVPQSAPASAPAPVPPVVPVEPTTPVEPGKPDPGPDPTDPEPALPPAKAPVLGTATLSCKLLHSVLHDNVQVSIEVTGVPGATLRPSADVASTGITTLDANGKGVVVFFPTYEQVNGGTKVSLTYFLGDKTGGSAAFDLGRFAPVSWPQCWLNPPEPIPGEPITDPAPTPPPAPSTTPPPAPATTPAETSGTAPTETTPAPTEPAPAPAEPVAPAPTAPAPAQTAPATAPETAGPTSAPATADPTAPAAPTAPAVAPAPGA
ncbi:sigma-70 family RNA polymerase sigma factor [Microbacterium sp. NPDC089698]|uniref:sigma-70 family RNA polymerase sigma factor n=1 Tax=Microbacterium sp. NPDC089698 TaxID=3364200 RepID=UPI0038260C13